MTALRPVVLGLCGVAATCLAQPAAPSDQPSLEHSVGALLRTLRERGDLPPLDRAARERALAGMLGGLRLGGASPEPSGPCLVQAPVALRGIYAYVRVDRVGEGLADALRELLADVADGHYEALVLDLRRTAGGGTPDLGDAFAALRRAAMPTMALLGAESSAGAAHVAGCLQRDLRAILVGQPPAPHPMSEEVVLSTGERVFLPAKPRGRPTAPPLRVDISVRDTHPATAASNSAYLEGSGALAARDECLRRAVDLLATMRALRQP